MKLNLTKAAKEFDACLLVGDLAVKANNGKRVIIKEAEKNNFLFGEIKYNKNKNFYNLKLPNDKKLILYYSNLEKVFTNNKTY